LVQATKKFTDIQLNDSTIMQIITTASVAILDVSAFEENSAYFKFNLSECTSIESHPENPDNDGVFEILEKNDSTYTTFDKDYYFFDISVGELTTIMNGQNTFDEIPENQLKQMYKFAYKNNLLNDSYSKIFTIIGY
jgi:hypothetical protein